MSIVKKRIFCPLVSENIACLHPTCHFYAGLCLAVLVIIDTNTNSDEYDSDDSDDYDVYDCVYAMVVFIISMLSNCI